MPAWARRSRPDRVRAPCKDAVKHRRSTPRISSAIAGWLLVKTRSGSLPGEGNLPIETMTALNAKTAKAACPYCAAIDGVARRRGDRVIQGKTVREIIARADEAE